MIISITNQKGGVGKTTLSVNLSYALASLGYKTLVIDVDPQGNCTDGLGINTHSQQKTVYDLLIDQVSITDIILKHQSQENLYIAPADMSLFGAEAELATEISRPFKLRQAIKPIVYDYDHIIIDCPPNLGVLTVNAILASTDLLVPLAPSSYALKGMSVLMNTLLIVQNDMEHYPHFLGVAINLYNPRNALHTSILKNTTDYLPDGKIFSSKIHRNPMVSEAEMNGMSVIEYRPLSNVSQMFMNLAKEIVCKNNERIEQRREKAFR